MIYEKTEAFCNQCNQYHPAEIEIDDKRVLGKVWCPIKPSIHQLSDHADLYLKIRNKLNFNLNNDLPVSDRAFVYSIEITNACNFKCPICYADSGSNPKSLFLSVFEIEKRILTIKKHGAKVVVLTGGEPLMHPEILTILKFVKKYRMKSIICSNGLLIAQKPNLAKELKKAGLNKFNLSLDTLNTQTQMQMKANDYIDMKIRTIKSVIDAGLGIGIIITVTTINLEEIHRLLAFILPYAPRLRMITIQGAGPGIRYELDHNTLVDRETIIKKITHKSILEKISCDDFRPFPNYAPWKIQGHPDCMVNTLLVVKNNEITPLSKYLDVDGFYYDLSRVNRSSSYFTKNILPVWFVIKRAKKNQLLNLIDLFMSRKFGIGKHSLVILGVVSYAFTAFQEKKKLHLCPMAFLTATGPKGACAYNGMGEGEVNSRLYNEKNNIF